MKQKFSNRQNKNKIAMEFHNSKQVVRVKLCEKARDNWYRIRKGTFFRQKGVYEIGYFFSSVETFNEPNRYIENNIVFYKPHVNVSFSNKTEKDFFFDTIEEANVFYNSLKDLIKSTI